MIKVALISHTAAFAGAERILFNMACLLEENEGITPIVFLPGEQTEESLFWKACRGKQIPVVWMGRYSGYSTWYLFDERNKRNADNKQIIWNAVQNLRKLLINLDIDLVIGNTATSLVPALASAQIELPYIAWYHGILDNANLPIIYDSEQRLLCDRIGMSLSQKVFCCSDWTRAFYEGYCVDKIMTLHNWTSDLLLERTSKDAQESYVQEKLEFDGESEDIVTFACLNSFEETKGILVLLEAVELLHKKGIKFKVDLYGSGPEAYVSKMKKFVADNKLEHYINIFPRTLDVASVYLNTKCLLQPSMLDSFGMTIIEAMSCKRAVIATDCGGPSEIVLDGETGYLVPKNDPVAFAEAMQKIIENPQDTVQMGENGRKRFETLFSAKVAAEKLIPIIQNIVHNFDGITVSQKLLMDLMLHQIELDGYGSIINAQILNQTACSDTYDPDSLCFSGVLKKSRKYGISGRAGELSRIGILVANLYGSLEHGSLKMNLYQQGNKIASSSLSGKELQMSGWTYFKIEKVHVSDAPMVLELIPKGFEGFGVFEVRERRTFIYKVFNKLGYPLKGMDVLQVSLV